MKHNTFLATALTAICLTSCGLCADRAPSFNADIRPVLAAKCLPCHGPDDEKREADLRLDVRDDVIDLGAIVPGEPESSELVRRVFSDEPGEQMPPPDSGETLTQRQKQLLQRWIADGAPYEKHWAFVPPLNPKVPAVNDPDWARNEIDHFVLARLDKENLRPAPEADRYTLVRRLYFDLIGLPPSPAQADAFVNDNSPRAYEKLVDRLLASEHYGERWARQWLDLARYSDTNGYEKDRPRSIWLYRDWVIKALNDDMPFDQFTVEQLAGDMLPHATVNQRIATGFHRNTMLNEEGGIDPLEYRFYAMVDRVATTGTVWMGLTTGCAQCHTHKYDPISHTEYYRLMALLNNADEPDLIVENTTTAKHNAEVMDQISALERNLARRFPPLPGDGPVDQRRQQHLKQSFTKWLADAQTKAVAWHVMRPYRLQSNLPKLELLKDGSVFSSGDITKRDVFTLSFSADSLPDTLTAIRLEALPDKRLPAGGPGRAYYEGRKGDFFLSEITVRADGNPLKIASASHSYGKNALGSGSADAANVLDGDGSTGWSTAEREGEPHQLVLCLAEPIRLSHDLQIELLFERHYAAGLGRFRLAAASSSKQPKATQLPVAIGQLLAREKESWTPTEKTQVLTYYLSIAPELAEARKQIDALRKKRRSFPTTMVMSERPADNPRKTFRHHRGEYLSPKEEVAPGVPEVFSESPDGGPDDRLGFARWLVSDRNPLVGRVAVNRSWRALFGEGLVRTNGDFGTQSEPPTHPELLDWLACEFVEQGWSMKKLHRAIVMSSTYRQSSNVDRDLLSRDPQNRLLARGARFRVDAEVVRDSMLKASGLLSSRMYGPSVYPPQPASVTALAYGNTAWKPSPGKDRYRRSLYTFSKRTAPFAAYSVFDSPSGETCIALRNRSNTPLQALTLLNDEMFLEMSRALAREALAPSRTEVAQRATYIFRQLLTRKPSERELASLVKYQQTQLKRLESGDLNPADIGGDVAATAELAAWAMVARVVMNLDEAITKN